MRIRHTKTRACLAALTAFCALGAAACDSPPIDLPRWLGGNSPDPTGVVEGTVLYSGPRPTCDFDADGNRPVEPDEQTPSPPR